MTLSAYTRIQVERLEITTLKAKLSTLIIKRRKYNNFFLWEDVDYSDHTRMQDVLSALYRHLQ